MVPKCATAAYSLSSNSMMSDSRVNFLPISITITPVAKGSKVPAWPIFFTPINLTRERIRLKEVLPCGLSTSKTPSIDSVASSIILIVEFRRIVFLLWVSFFILFRYFQEKTFYMVLRRENIFHIEIQIREIFKN
ncbi:Uncharacterised protein [Chlamydia trachomatis]|nr:Uncharacterised protein [Chlamydia trachomatis]